ncbi:MAG TPA: HEAT repeat domain-containing protein [Ignavibacteriaceae bacterium]
METDANNSEKLRIQNINFIDSDPSDGQVEFTFDAVKSGRIKGNVNDAEVQKILTYAVLNEQNPGTRLNSINVINANQIQKPDDEIKSTLIAVAKFDNNPGVRIEALKSLNKLPADEEIKNTLIYVLLNDTSSGIRIEAINSLVGASKSGVSLNQKDLMLLRDKIQTENNNYVKFQAKNIIKEY